MNVEGVHGVLDLDHIFENDGQIYLHVFRVNIGK